MRTDGETDMTKLAVAFCNFANAPGNILVRHLSHAHGEDGARMEGPMADSIHRQCKVREIVRGFRLLTFLIVFITFRFAKTLRL
jgi:hypothetical protein